MDSVLSHSFREGWCARSQRRIFCHSCNYTTKTVCRKFKRLREGSFLPKIKRKGTYFRPEPPTEDYLSIVVVTVTNRRFRSMILLYLEGAL